MLVAHSLVLDACELLGINVIGHVLGIGQPNDEARLVLPFVGSHLDSVRFDADALDGD